MDMDNAAELLSVSDWWWGEALLLLLLPIVEEAALSLYRFLLLDAFFLDLSNISQTMKSKIDTSHMLEWLMQFLFQTTLLINQ